MEIKNVYNHEEIVYLRTDTDQKPRIITSIEVFKRGELLYKLSQSTTSSYHYDYEISRDRNILLATSG